LRPFATHDISAGGVVGDAKLDMAIVATLAVELESWNPATGRSEVDGGHHRRHDISPFGVDWQLWIDVSSPGK